MPLRSGPSKESLLLGSQFKARVGIARRARRCSASRTSAQSDVSAFIDAAESASRADA